MYTVVFLEKAKRDLERIYSFCSQVSNNYASKTIRNIYSYILSLEIFPKGYPQITLTDNYYERRRIPLKRYQIMYVVYDDYVIVTQIFDIRRNPKKFKIN